MFRYDKITCFVTRLYQLMGKEDPSKTVPYKPDVWHFELRALGENGPNIQETAANLGRWGTTYLP